MRTFVLAFTSCLAAAGAVLHQAAFSFPQPSPLASWTNTSAGPTPCTTEAAYAIRSFATGWPGQCTDLLPYAPSTLPVVPMTMEECRKGCVADVRCSVWQFIGGDGTGTCFSGVGDHCIDRDNGAKVNVTGAERIQRGSVKVLSNLMNFNGNSETLWVFGLHPVGVATAGDVVNNTLRCRDWCYSNIDCTFWQFNDQCYVETKDVKAQFPLNLTKNIAATTGAISSKISGITPAHSMRAGEYIQHTCVTAEEVAAAKAAAAAAAAEKAAADGGGYTWLYVALGVLALVALAALAYCLINGGGKKGGKRAVKKTRAVKAVPKVEAAEPESVPLMPLMMPAPYAQAPQMQFAAPPMQFPGY